MEMVYVVIIIMFAFLLIGKPIFISMGLATMLGLVFFTDILLDVMVTRIFGGINSFGIMAMPFYILAAYIMDVGGLSRRVMNWAFVVVGKIPSGLAIATQLASMLFGALSGSSPATVAAIGSITYPELTNRGYGKKFSLGLVTASGSISILIPPSITFIIFGTVTGTSVGSLFIAGIIPGIIVGLGMMAYCLFYGIKNEVPVSKELGEESWSKELFDATKDAIWAILVPIIIVGGIYSGIFTPTEAAGVAVVYAMFVGVVIYKEIDWKTLLEATSRCSVTLAQVMLLTAFASALTWLMTVGQGPQMLTQQVIEMTGGSEILFLIFMNIALLILGMFIEPVSITVITAPLMLPIATQFGIDPVHLGVIMTANVAIGMFTPPFGLNLFITPTFSKENVSTIMSSVVPFLLISILTLLLITYIPEISLYLPNVVFGM